MANLRLSLVIAVLACSGLAACSVKVKCTPGYTRLCVCPDGNASSQTCEPTRSWGECRCEGSTPAKDAGSDASTPVQPTSDAGNKPVTKDSGTTPVKDAGSSHPGEDGGSNHQSDASLHGDAGSHLDAAKYAGPCTNANCASTETCEKTMSGVPAASFSYCAATCNSATDCAAPTVGAATKACNAVTHVCELSCNGLAACPPGMMCNTAPLALSGVCTWPG